MNLDPLDQLETQQQRQAAQRIYQNLKDQADTELRNMAAILASKKPEELLAAGTEFQLRDHVHRIGAASLEASLEEVKKKAT